MKKVVVFSVIAMCVIMTGCSFYRDVDGKLEDTSSIETTSAPETTVETTTEATTEETTIAVVDIMGQEYTVNAESVDLSGTQIDDFGELIIALSELENLKNVKLDNIALSMDDCILLKEGLPNVAFDLEVALFEGIVLNNETVELDISKHKVKDVDKFSKVISYFPNLTYIDMCDCGLGNDQMEVLRDTYTNIKFVWKVSFGRWTIRTDTVAFSTMKTCSDTFCLGSEEAQVLKYCTDMVALDIGHNSVLDVSFLEYMPNLKILILVDQKNRDTGKYLNDLSVLKNCPKLEYLEFFVGSVKDTSFLQYLPNLKDLNVSYNPISDITYLKNLPNIERLFLEHTRVTEAEYEELKATYPNAQVIFYGEGSIDHGWREHERYFAMRSMFKNNNIHELFAD